MLKLLCNMSKNHINFLKENEQLFVGVFEQIINILKDNALLGFLQFINN